jgi:hypothetical protein
VDKSAFSIILSNRCSYKNSIRSLLRSISRNSSSWNQRDMAHWESLYASSAKVQNHNIKYEILSQGVNTTEKNQDANKLLIMTLMIVAS